MEELLLIGRQIVEAGADDPLERLRKRQLLGRASLEIELRELLRVEGVAARAVEQGLLTSVWEHRPLEQRAHQARGVAVGEWLERDRRGVELAAAPVRAPRQQLRPRRAHHEHRHVAHPVDERVHKVEQPVVRPLKILEDEHERALGRELLEEAPPGCERLDPTVSSQLGEVFESGERSKAGIDPVGVRGIDGLRCRLPQLLGGGDIVVRLVDAGLCLDDLREGPERDPVAVREAATLAPRRELGLGVDHARELVEQAALADPGNAEKRNELGCALLACAIEGGTKGGELAFAANEIARDVVEHLAPEPRASLGCLPDRDRLRFPLRPTGPASR